jgi:DNA polymerase III subunit delta'
MMNSLYPWQNSAWQQLQQLRARLPHAILFHGPEGIGKTAFAEHFAQSVLCQKPQEDGHACGECDSCNWFSQYSHPDYRRVRPEILEEDGASEEGTEESEGKKASKSTKAPSKEIKIDQIRALADFMNISTHRQGMRVVVLYPAEALNTAAANALLKTLEEPPPDTLFLLVSNSLDRLLPTILSRCRKFSLTMPQLDEALAWLQQQGIKDADIWLAEQGGAPLAAYAVAQTEVRETMDDFLRHLAKPSAEGALKTAERLQKTPVIELVAWLQRWLYDVFSLKFSGRIRYYPRYRKDLEMLAERADATQLLHALKAVNERRAIAEQSSSSKTCCWIIQLFFPRDDYTVKDCHGRNNNSSGYTGIERWCGGSTPIGIVSSNQGKSGALCSVHAIPCERRYLCANQQAVQNRRRDLSDSDADGRSDQISDRRQDRVGNARWRQ